ncbi:MAG: magnesium-translocating P-type ATPase [Kouleothrix sp.]|jgi:Mg2+-importing ATPase|nr:magnesium-translocating P-type ATPase [Kouleothrix sp.]
MQGVMHHTATPPHTAGQIAEGLLAAAQGDIDAALARAGTTPAGLSNAEAGQRLKRYGFNELAHGRRSQLLTHITSALINPLVILLGILALISLSVGDVRAAVMMALMVVLGVSLRFVQEWRADAAAAQLTAMVHTTATAVREGRAGDIALRLLVPGDIVQLSAGDLVPADLRLISAKDLFINQAPLTGEALPVEKHALSAARPPASPLDLQNICFFGTSIVSGTASALVLATGSATYFGSMATHLADTSAVVSSFDQGLNRFTWLLLRFMAVMVPLVFLINGIGKGNWLEAFLFALSVAVGLTPEMLPMIVTVCLSKGALAMSRQQVIVKRLSAIQNFGAMDVLCTDKTGTLTEGRVVLEKHLDLAGAESPEVLNYSYLNSFHQTGLKNMLDMAVLAHVEVAEALQVREHYRKIDEIPFDFVRRRMSVVVEDPQQQHILICKGAVEEILAVCTYVELHGARVMLDASHQAQAAALVDTLNDDGFRVLALAYTLMPGDQHTYEPADESALTLLGLLAFLDPPKPTARQAIAELEQRGVQVKVLTGDNERVARTICTQVGLATDRVVLGSALDAWSDAQLADAAESALIFAKLAPAHKERIIAALRGRGHVVGFMGDGINDAAALKAADVGISVDSAVDIAKESSDIILLENSLLVLQAGVLEGRRVFGNILKYVRMAASSNFGNMFSVVGASLFLPFLPMLPVQVLTNNLLYDFSQTTIPTDSVDAAWLQHARSWNIGATQRFILVIGPISSIFDYATFAMMLYVFNAWANPALFHTGWFVESLLTQTLIIHVIRTNKIPFLQSRASLPLTLTSLLIVAIGIWLPFSPFADALGFVALPPLYWPLVGLMLLGYVVLTQLVKTWFVRRYEGG